MAQIKHLPILGLFLFLTACRAGVPDYEDLRSIPGFSLDQKMVSVQSKTSPTFAVSGTCIAGFTDIQVSFDSGSTWISVRTLASEATINCQSDQTFRLKFTSSISSYIQAGSAAAEGTWKFRATSEFGNSDSETLSLATAQRGHLILAGSVKTTSGTLILKSRVGTIATSSSNGNYILRGTIRR